MRQLVEGERIRVVVTGMGAISPLGNNVEESWQGIIAGKSGVELIDPVFNSRVKFAATVKNFVPPAVFGYKEIRASVDRSALYSTAAALEALTDARLSLNPDNEDGIVGLRIGSGIAGASFIGEMQDCLREGGDRKVPVKSILTILLERVASVPSIKLKVTGPVAASVAACATGNQNIIDAVRIIREGDASVMLAGAAEAAVGPIGLSSFSQIRALSGRNGDPKAASRPFNKDVEGFVMGEGAAVLILEELNHALKRRANIYAEILGYGESADADDDVQPNGRGSERAMRKALDKAGITPDQVDYINAHGTSTMGDEIESESMLRIFGNCNPRPLVSSTKSMTGHMLGAAGAFEAVLCIKAIQTGCVPPTINLHDPINDYFDYVPNKARKAMVNVAMSNSIGFGGLNTALILGGYQEQKAA